MSVSLALRPSAEWGDREIRDVASMHADLLPHSPVVELGQSFMQRFYYRVLPKDGLIRGVAAYVDDEPGGFIVYTREPSTFMRSAARRHFLALAFSLGLAVLSQPKRLKSLNEARSISSELDEDNRSTEVAELLSFGVLAPFRTRKFMKESGVQLSAALMDAAVSDLQAEGAGRVRSVVDQDNLEARMFYLGNGWTPGKPVTGWKVPTVEFLLDL